MSTISITRSTLPKYIRNISHSCHIGSCFFWVHLHRPIGLFVGQRKFENFDFTDHSLSCTVRPLRFACKCSKLASGYFRLSPLTLLVWHHMTRAFAMMPITVNMEQSGRFYALARQRFRPLLSPGSLDKLTWHLCIRSHQTEPTLNNCPHATSGAGL